KTFIMPQNKRILFAPIRLRTALRAQALCHPARLEIIELLRHYDFLLCSEIVDYLPLQQSTISYHLSVLLQTDIIVRDEMAGVVGYRINRLGWRTAKEYLQQFFAEVG
ncbi:MAG: ArsR family transcriptional regulator, partial [Bacteroidota bacterium]